MDNDLQVLRQYEKGNSAKKALLYFENWLRDKRQRLNRELMNAKDEASVMEVWRKLKIYDEFEADINRDIQSGELALDEMEEEY